jgi:hypothetical protein
MQSGDRRFTMLDAMILVAFTALGMALSWRMSYETQLRFDSLVFRGTYQVFPYLAAMSFGLLVLSIRQPRPAFRRWVTQPGPIACAVVSLALAATAAVTCRWIALPGGPSMNFSFLFVWISNSRDAPVYSVAGAWAVLALLGRWRARASWIDRAGRLLILGWLALYAFRVLVLW